MPNPNSGILDLGEGAPTLVPTRLAGWQQTARPAGRLRSAVHELVTRFLVWRAQQATLRLLRSLDTATLRDLGLMDIESEVYGDPRDRIRGYDTDWWRKGCERVR
jgi:uncharacterized protein YjiS (DUF1127 family)